MILCFLMKKISEVLPNKNLYITIKGSNEINRDINLGNNTNQPRFDYYKLKISNFSFSIKDVQN